MKNQFFKFTKLWTIFHRFSYNRFLYSRPYGAFTLEDDFYTDVAPTGLQLFADETLFLRVRHA